MAARPVDRIAKMIPEAEGDLGQALGLKELKTTTARASSRRNESEYETNPETRKLVSKMARSLEGSPAMPAFTPPGSSSCDEALEDLIPLCRRQTRPT
jgi:DNA polymerase III alpha subunit